MTLDGLAEALLELGWRVIDAPAWTEYRAPDGIAAIAWGPLDAAGPEPLATLFPGLGPALGRVSPADALQWAQALGSGRAGSA